MADTSVDIAIYGHNYVCGDILYAFLYPSTGEHVKLESINPEKLDQSIRDCTTILPVLDAFITTARSLRCTSEYRPYRSSALIPPTSSRAKIVFVKSSTRTVRRRLFLARVSAAMG
jgi:hypothetical protein